MKKLKWGVLSTAKIAVSQVIPAIMECQFAEITSIASRNKQKADEAARNLNISNSCGSYEELLENPDIDIIYNPLPNHLHVPWTIKAMQAGKHVLCEKPVALSHEESRLLLDASMRYPHIKVMEAFMYRFHPQWIKTKELIDNGDVGSLKTIHSFFSYFNRDPENVRNKPDIGGGGLMDIGCYCVSLSRFLFNQEPERTVGILEYDPDFKVDRLASAILDFGCGTSTFTCSTQLVPYQRVIVYGTDGFIEIEIPFNAPINIPCRLWLNNHTGKHEISFDNCNQYTLQADLFSEAVLGNVEVPTPLEDAVNNIGVIEAVFESAKKKQWIDIAQ